jgi:hypothetical protein
MADAAAREASGVQMWAYRAFGFSIGSAMPLPELLESAPVGPPDVRLRCGIPLADLPAGVEAEPFIETGAGVSQIRTPAGRIRIADGCAIDLDPTAGAADVDLSPYVLGSALAILCHQRGLLPLHASAVAVQGGAVAFVGASGAGKSTLAASLARAGFQVLCDDLCAVTFRAEQPVFELGVTRLKLCRDSLEMLGADIGTLDPIGDTGKYALPTGFRREASGSGAIPLRALYCLTTKDGGDPRLRRLRGPEAAAALLAGVHRWPTAMAMGLSGRVFRQVVQIARTQPIFEAPDPLDRSAPFLRLETIMASIQSMV